MLPEAAGRLQHFQVRGLSFSLYGPTSSLQITYLFFPVINWLTSGSTQLCHWIRRAYVRSTNHRKKFNERTRASSKAKKDALKNRSIWNYFMIAASNSPIFLQKFSKIIFSECNFVQSLKLRYKNNFHQSLRITRNQTFFYHKLGSRKRGNSSSVSHRISLKYSKDQRG